MVSPTPHLVFLSGSLGPRSRCDRVAEWCAKWCADRGADVTVFSGLDLEFPLYRPNPGARDDRLERYLRALAAADGVVLVSPAYHGSLSGLLKNALDYVNDLSDDARPFLDGRPVGCVAVAAGEQAAATTLITLRTITHALRGWPTPLGVTLSTQSARTDATPFDVVVLQRLQSMLGQVLAWSRGVVPTARPTPRDEGPSAPAVTADAAARMEQAS